MRSLYSYANSHKRQECYQFAIMSSKMLCETRLNPRLHYKARLAYEWLRSRDRACGAMDSHAS